jgi:hypothetical protein
MSKPEIEKSLKGLSISKFANLSEEEQSLFAENIQLSKLDAIYLCFRENVESESTPFWDILEENSIAPQDIVKLLKLSIQQEVSLEIKYSISKVLEFH